jgi:signal transduction histidine kinase
MAEMATGVLHNIGNVLNSINISVRVLQESIQSSSVTRLPLLVKMLNEHEDDLGDFLSENPQGRKLVPYLNKLTHAITLEKDAFGDEVQCLLGNIDVVAQIIASQQSLAQKGGFQELVDLQALLENVLKMQSHGLDKYRIRIKRQYQDVPSVMAEKHKLLQVVVNLVSNAKQALRDCDKEDRELTVGLAPDQDSIRITVEDNGVGISEDDFEQIFSHGFTTKTDGHGFGLHSSALAAHEIGGSLSAHSDGVGLGAKFTLRLPVTADELIAEASM